MFRGLIAWLLVPVLWSLAPEHLEAQAREVQRTVEVQLIDSDDAVCQAAEERIRPAPPRRAMCFVGLASHPSGIQRVLLNGSETVLEARSTAETRFVGFVPATALSRDIEIVAYSRSGQGVLHVYGMNAPGGGASISGPLTLRRTAAAPTFEERPAPITPAQPATEYLTLVILEPAAWLADGTPTVRVPPGDSVRVVGRTQHPSGISRVTVNGREVRLQPHRSGAQQFVTYIVVGTAQTGVSVVAYPRRGEPLTRAYRINPSQGSAPPRRTSS
jgi:hypothetical protein